MVFWPDSGLLWQGSEGYLGGVEEPGSVFRLDGADEHAVSGAGDEVRDILMPGEWGHGGPV